MASSQKTADFITEQMAAAGIITTRKMFGEYAVYLDGKVIAFVCNDQLFIKPTDEGKKFYPDYVDAPAYPGSKMYMLISEDKWDDRDFMKQMAVITASALPAPKPKKK